MTTLVTGGAGYIGSHTVRALLARGEQAVVLDSMEFGHEAAIPGVPLVVGNTADPVALAQVFEHHDIDSVVHFAAYKNAGESVHKPERYFRNNVAGTLSLLEAAAEAGVRAVVFSSTCAVYGTPDAPPVDETAPLHPESPYGESKLMCEQMLRWFDAAHGLRHVALRYFNAAGAAMDGTNGEDWTVTLNLVPLVMKAVLERGPKLKVFGTDYPTPDGTCIRDYIHVEDLADAHLRALDYLRSGGASTAINLGTGTGSSVKEVLGMTEEISGHTVPAEFAERRAGDPVAVFADNRKARDLLGWQPVYGLREIIQSAYRWHASHPDGFVG